MGGAHPTKTEGNATFTVSPTAEFEYGTLVNVKFTVEFASPVAGFEKLIVDGGQVIGVNATTHDPVTPVQLQDKGPAKFVFDFNAMAFPEINSVMWTITGATQGNPPGALDSDATIEIASNNTATQVRDAMKLKFETMGLVAVAEGTTKLVVSAKPGKQLNNITIETNVGGALPAGPSAIAVKGGASFNPDFTWKKP